MRVTPVNQNFNKHRLGTEFDLPDAVARIFIKVGKLREVTVTETIVNTINKLREVTQDVKAEEISPRTGKPKRTYQRRDMQAQA
jgi:hypothetical protein